VNFVMSDLAFKIARWTAVPVAILLAGAWMLAPSRLQLSQAKEITVTANRLQRKNIEYLDLQTSNFQEIQTPCYKARTLCQAPVPRKSATLRVWLQDAGPMMGYWIVSAEFNGQQLVTPDSQASVFRTEKIMWGLGALTALAVAFMLWYFAPFKSLDSDDI